MPFHRPYADDAANTIYNLLFADTPDQFNKDGWQPALFAATLDEPAVRAIATDESAESRVRLLACNRLRRDGVEVPPRLLLGVIAEVPLEQGLDTLGAYADGRVRYINQAGGMVVIEDEIAAIAVPVRNLFDASQTLLDQIGPWTSDRLPAPSVRRVRLTFLASDGLYFGEGDMADLVRDRLGAPVFNAAANLLAAVIDFASADETS